MTDSNTSPQHLEMRRPFDDPAYKALRDGDRDAFTEFIANREKIDFSGCDLGGVDLRKVDISGVELRGARLKGADLRGLDLSDHNLDGVSINNARISGTLFPRDISADEIRMSLQEGTRIRHGEG